MTPVVEALADDAVLLRFGDRIDADLNAHVLRLAARLHALAPAWLHDVVPAYASLAVFFDPAAFDHDGHAQVVAALAALGEEQAAAPTAHRSHRMVEIPVCYGGTHGADLDAAAAELGIAPPDLVRRHSDALYTVAMIGFAPGFPYLLGLDPGLALPRLATPRTVVPAGSVAIGGAQTGIYPRQGAGGWRLLGRTSATLFDPARSSPALLAPGDRVRFVPVQALDA